jgi:hypothetical protein
VGTDTDAFLKKGNTWIIFVRIRLLSLPK